MKPDAPAIRGAKRIAHEMGVSEATFYRMKRRGDLGFITKGGSGGRTSPLYAERKALDTRKTSRKD
ncbi:hypothetical protein [Ancylobacter sp. G4_0304]|uniref:hypothetical protein n=1 Tax=Ancylobacter sp. G4_0304 TaxID=3114289 RepID=UPI0039C6A508